MSTIKADAVTAVSTNGDLSLDGLGTGGVSIASTLKMTKGGDIASASPLVIDVDGNYFDVTGTTNFAAMTVESGNFFMLQFDGALTITHGSGIELPGAANLTTATGDRLICYATAANTVEVMSVETEAAASGGAWALITATDISDDATINFTGFDDSTYSSYRFWMENVVPATDGAKLWFRTSTDGGSNYDDSASDYDWSVVMYRADTTTIYGMYDDNAAYIKVAGEGSGSYRIDSTASNGGVNGTIEIFDPGNASSMTYITWQASWAEIGGLFPCAYSGQARRNSAADVDAVRFMADSGNLTSGRILFEGLKK